MIIVQRIEVSRLAVQKLRDGAVTVGEGLDYVCSCSCVFTIGFRLDNDEYTMGADPCDLHRPYYGLILEALLNERESDSTEEALALILSSIPKEAT